MIDGARTLFAHAVNSRAALDRFVATPLLLGVAGRERTRLFGYVGVRRALPTAGATGTHERK